MKRPVSEMLAQMQEAICQHTTWRGVKALKSPVDFWIYQEIIEEVRPDLIIEIGVNHGGSTLALADLCRLVGHGHVLGIDTSLAMVHPKVIEHQRITLIEGSAADRFESVAATVKSADRVLVIEDSDHTYKNTLKVLQDYSKLVTPGSYMIVEDTICHHGLAAGEFPGAYEAVDKFLSECNDFERDERGEKFGITWNPGGYLRRKAS